MAEGLQDNRFIAPENIQQILNKTPKFSTRETDIYALGIVFWQLASGQEPRRATKKVLCAIEREPIPEDCPEEFKKLIIEDKEGNAVLKV